jgi:protein associated with RNAse G/E
VTGRDVRVVYTKYDGSLHWHHPMRYLGADGHGTWLGAPARTPIQRGNEPPIVLEQPWVQLIPDGQWWTAAFNGEPAATEIYCDIGTPPRWLNPGEVTMADLDLDVLRMRADGRVVLVDEDEFAEHQVRYGYPAEVIRQAEQAAAWLLAAIQARAEPFDTGYQAWLDMVIPDVGATLSVASVDEESADDRERPLDGPVPTLGAD